MPSFLELIVERLGASLDEKAREALLQLDGVSALSILRKLTGRGVEVKNPSAFVATAVNKARQQGAGPEELRCALEQIKEEGLIDDNAVDMISKGKAALPDVCGAVSVFLSQDESSVRNPSAYMTRSIVNASKHVQPGVMSMPPPPPMMSYGYGMAPGYNVPVMQSRPVPMVRMAPMGLPNHPLVRVLDDKARQALEGAGYDSAMAILAELQAKGQSVRNPSAYVIKSVANAREGRGAGAMAAGGSPASFQIAATPPPPAMRNGAGQHPGVNQQTMLDDRAHQALEELPPDAAAEVWKQFESVAMTVRNPSAYIMRSVENYWKSAGRDAPNPLGNSLVDVAPPHVPAWELIEPWRGRLDENAVHALEGADPQVVASCLAELEAKMDTIRNPSAYVVRSVTNAKKGGRQAGPEVDEAAVSLEAELGTMPEPLDDKARAALEEVGPVAALSIVQSMKKIATVGNPSAYVMKAVTNEKQNWQGRPLKRVRV